jgi:SAM-dependent methyltransferase
MRADGAEKVTQALTTETKETVDYAGHDLASMSFAENYHRWILDIFRPFLGTRLVEVGAGMGAFSELLLTERRPESLSLVEPSEMYRHLTARLARLRTPTEVKTYNSLFSRAADEIAAAGPPDSIIYVNVLEHVADDEAELGLVRRTLADGGRVLIYVPALRWLYGSFDRQVGHFRRYTKPELEGKCRRAGLRVLRSGYMDLPGILPWWIKYRLLKSETMEPGLVSIYNRYFIPVIRAAESVVRPPIGKSLFVVAVKV